MRKIYPKIVNTYQMPEGVEHRKNEKLKNH